MQLIRPRSLVAGSRLGVFLPSEPVGPDRLGRLMRNVVRLERTTGLRVVVPDDEVLCNFALYRDPRTRADELHALLSDPLIDGLIAAWGGKACNELLQHLDYRLVADARKVILGFSDVGVLSNAVTTETGLIGFYGPNVLGKLDQSSQPGWDLLLDCDAWMQRPLLRATTDRVCDGTRFSGTLVGGNLSTFTIGLSGTRWLPARGRIVGSRRVFFFEGTEGVQAQRQLVAALNNQGFFEDVAGVVVGHSPRIDDRWSVSQRDALADVLPPGLPLVIIDTFGHADLPNPILPVGVDVEVSVHNGVCTLTASEPIVA